MKVTKCDCCGSDMPSPTVERIATFFEALARPEGDLYDIHLKVSLRDKCKTADVDVCTKCHGELVRAVSKCWARLSYGVIEPMDVRHG